MPGCRWKVEPCTPRHDVSGRGLSRYMINRHERSSHAAAWFPLLALVALATAFWGVQTWSWVRDRRELISENRADSPYELRVTEGGQRLPG